MTEYVPALIWLLSGVICLIIAQRRQIRQTAFRKMLVTVLGPVAIPWVLVIKREHGNLAGEF